MLAVGGGVELNLSEYKLRVQSNELLVAAVTIID